MIDSAEIRTRFNLQDFTGQLCIHALGIQGHDIVKYALDTYGDAPAILSCTHDANSWPADFYAGLPAPAKGEDVVLWLQNSQPFEYRRAKLRLTSWAKKSRAAADPACAVRDPPPERRGASAGCPLASADRNRGGEICGPAPL